MNEQEPKKNPSTDEWRELFADIGNQVRRDMARMVGASEDATWKDIGNQTDEAVRQKTARAVGAEQEADWEDIGEHLERSTRREIARIVGADEQADWGMIGQAVSDGIEGFLNSLFSVKSRGLAVPLRSLPIPMRLWIPGKSKVRGGSPRTIVIL